MTRRAAASQSARASYALFAWTTWLSASLLFFVQPLMARTILPWFGGAPAVWTTALLFFQVVLLAGYAYAHALSVRLPERVQLAIHVLLVLLALCVLPIIPDPQWKLNAELAPAPRIALLLLVTIGLPYFVLSTTGPLLQRWVSDVLPDRSPYPFYALSNVGSLLALLAYPLFVEPALSTDTQARLWSWAFSLLAICLVACAAVRWKVSRVDTPEIQHAAPPSITRRLTWLWLALVPSWMLLAITNALCIDVAAVPFLWVAPLSIYLLSFVACFARRSLYHRGVWVALWLLSSMGICAHLIDPTGMRLGLQLAVYLSALAACAMLCHGELAQLRPEPAHLTSFYLSMSLGGALGGVFVGVLAPRVFSDYFELHLGIVACYVATFAQLLAQRQLASTRIPLLLTGLGLGVTSLALLAAVELARGADGISGKTLHQSRSFYGVLRVGEVKGGRVLTHGRIWHGMQRTDPGRTREPTLYYGAQSGIVRLLEARDRSPARIGVAGLGVGTLALYGRAGDVFRFYEIDPAVIDVARTHFSFLRDSAATIELVPGDARISLEHEPPNHFDVLVLDAFSSDSVPAHLLTVEAIDGFLRHVVSDGVLAYHVSNRYLDLAPVLAGNARELGLAFVLVTTPPDYARLLSASTWVFMSRDARRLARWPKTDVPHPVVWTDTRSSLIDVLR